MSDRPPRKPRPSASRSNVKRGPRSDTPPAHRGGGGERIAKVIARAGVASRRDAEAMVLDGRVTVNGKLVDSPATNVRDSDKITVDGKPLPRKDGARVWLYHKPAGLVTTEKDEKGRETVFDALPEELGRVLSVGRLDLTSEGLLLLTNDGGIKRRLELPETGWLRRYRVRVNGKPDDAALEKLREGITVDGEDFAPMQVTLDRQQGANAWLTIGLREGRNREIRRAAEAVGLVVNRLIRVSYGPFQLGNLAAGEVEEVRPRALRDQLGSLFDGELAETRRVDTSRPDRKPRASGDRLVDKGRGDRGDRPDRGPRKGPYKGSGDRNDDGGGDRKFSKGPRRRDDDDRRDFKSGPRRSDRPDRSDRFDRGAEKGADRAARPSRPRTGDAPMTRGDVGDKPKTKAQRKAEMRADTSVSLRKGGQRGRGIAKAKKPSGGKPFKRPGDKS